MQSVSTEADDSSPRIRGGDPDATDVAGSLQKFSPHTRG
ncbi:Protein of unknown function [Propionibacterium freudenreichii]|nr:Protein of unknown function [Propionibacterium freudenreichii]